MPASIRSPDERGDARRARTLIEDFDDLVPDETSPDYLRQAAPVRRSRQGRHEPGPGELRLGILVRNAGVAPSTRPANGSHGAPTAAPTTRLRSASTTSRALGRAAASTSRASPRSSSTPTATWRWSTRPSVVDRHRQDDHHALRAAAVPLRRRSTADKGQNNAARPRSAQHRSPTRSYAAFYYPWIVTSDPQTGARKLVPPGGHVLGVYARTDYGARRVQGAGQRDRCAARSSSSTTSTTARRTMLNPRGVNAIRQFPGPRHPRLGRAHAHLERAVEVRQRAAAVHLPRALDLRRHAVGGVRAERRSSCGRASSTRSACSCARSGGSARCSDAPRRRRSSSPATARR